MALIKCPECGQNISSESDTCIHCGYPLKKVTIINGSEYDFNDELVLVISQKNIEAIKSIREKTGLGLSDGKKILDFMISNRIPPKTFTPTAVQQSNVIKCPKCGSTNIQAVPRKWSLLAGFMTNKVDRVCMNCKTKF